MGRKVKTEPSSDGFFNSGGIHKTRIDGKKTKVCRIWENMRQRCGLPTLKERCKSYERVTCCEEWLDFQVFAEWFENQKTTGYYQDDYHLDKDILGGDSKIYSPSTCCFIPREINNALVRRDKDGTWGVYKSDNYFEVKTNWCERKRFIHEEDAFLYYKKEKEQHLKFIAEKYKMTIDPLVYQKLITYEVVK